MTDKTVFIHHAAILNENCEQLCEVLRFPDPQNKIDHESKKIQKKCTDMNLQPNERKKIVSKKLGNWLVQRGEEHKYYYVTLVDETCPERQGHAFLDKCIVNISTINHTDTNELKNYLETIATEMEQQIHDDNLVSATGKVDLAKDKLEDALEQAMKNNANLVIVDDKAKYNMELARDFADDAAELEHVMEQRKRQMKFAYIAGVSGGVGLIGLPILQSVLGLAGMGILPI